MNEADATQSRRQAAGPAQRATRSDSCMLGWPSMQPVAAGALIVLAALIPLGLGDQFWMGELTLALIWMTLNQSWNLVLGFSGVWNFGHLALYASGGYTAALVSLHWHIPFELALLLAGLASAAIAMLLAIPSLRLRGIYVSLLTFSFAEVFRLLVIADQSGFTGGTFGLSGFDGFGLSTLSGTDRARVLYWIALAGVVVTAVVMYIIVRSPLGSGLKALRDNAALAAARGVSPRRYQIVAFGISGFFAGLAGGLYSYTYGVISPSVMGLTPMTLLVTMLVVGGLGTLLGPILGTLVITLISAELEQWTEARDIVLGVILLVMVVAVPRGLLDIGARLAVRARRWADEPYDELAGGRYYDEPSRIRPRPEAGGGTH